jgi:glycosyltransferase involved in cell wall biosynthesis
MALKHSNRSGLGPVSVVIACYNDADIVERNLAAFARQSYRDFELIIADDGSHEDYRPILERWAPRFEHPIQHVRHEDLGFRKTRVLNRAVRVSRFDRVIFVDMDCLPHRDFVRNHVRYLETGGVLACRRVNVQRQDVPSAEKILRNGLPFGSLRLVSLWLRGRAELIEHGIVLPMAYETGYRGILGSNFSIWKKDLERINGFNAEFAGPGWEDTDIDYRLRLAGVKIRTLRHRIVEYHVEHPVRVNSDKLNYERLAAVQTHRLMLATVGLAEIREGDFEHMVYHSNGRHRTPHD